MDAHWYQDRRFTGRELPEELELEAEPDDSSVEQKPAPPTLGEGGTPPAPKPRPAADGREMRDLLRRLRIGDRIVV